MFDCSRLSRLGTASVNVAIKSGYVISGIVKGAAESNHASAHDHGAPADGVEAEPMQGGGGGGRWWGKGGTAESVARSPTISERAFTPSSRPVHRGV